MKCSVTTSSSWSVLAVLARSARLLVLLDNPDPLACFCSDWPCWHYDLIQDSMLGSSQMGGINALRSLPQPCLHAYCMLHLGFTVDGLGLSPGSCSDDPGMSPCSCLDDPGTSQCSCLDDSGMPPGFADQCTLKDMSLHPAVHHREHAMLMSLYDLTSAWIYRLPLMIQ